METSSSDLFPHHISSDGDKPSPTQPPHREKLTPRGIPNNNFHQGEPKERITISMEDRLLDVDAPPDALEIPLVLRKNGNRL